MRSECRLLVPRGDEPALKVGGGLGLRYEDAQIVGQPFIPSAFPLLGLVRAALHEVGEDLGLCEKVLEASGLWIL